MVTRENLLGSIQTEGRAKGPWDGTCTVHTCVMELLMANTLWPIAQTVEQQTALLTTSSNVAMVLQNKYKARASRRYNSARGGTSDGRGHGGGRGRGAPRRLDGSSFPSLPGHEHGELDKGDDEDRSTESEDSEARRQMSKYAPRKLASNAWRFEKEEEPEGTSRRYVGGACELSG